MLSPGSALWLAALCAASAATPGCTVRSEPDGGGDRRDSGVPDGGTDAPRIDADLDAPFILDPDAACASAGVVPADVVRPPVDIVWVVDNSTSLAVPIMEVREGLNAFADQLFASGLDYRMILISLRTPRTGRLPICIDPPLAGAGCADGERFFQVDVDVRSTQLLEVLLGTLGQTDGYVGPPSTDWRPLLRDGAHKTIVVVTDDNQRTCARPHMGGSCTAGEPILTELSLEDFAGGPDPFNGTTLGPGILTAAYGSLFEGYVFDGIYGWGSDTDPDAVCTYGDGTMPPNSGYTYSTLVARTGGVRAQICSDSSAWDDFFTEVAGGVVEAAPIACEIDIPEPPEGMFFLPTLVNVDLRGTAGTTRVGYVPDAASCDATRGGWYYDDATTPTRILLCPASCDFARETVTDPVTTGIDVQFGCDSVPI